MPIAGLEQENPRPDYDVGGLVIQGSLHDPKIAVRRIPALFPQNQPENRQAPQPRNFQIARSGGEARARRTILQAPLKLRKTRLVLQPLKLMRQGLSALSAFAPRKEPRGDDEGRADRDPGKIPPGVFGKQRAQ